MRFIAVLWFLFPFFSYLTASDNRDVAPYILGSFGPFMEFIFNGFRVPLFWLLFFIPGTLMFIFPYQAEEIAENISAPINGLFHRLFGPKKIRVRLQDGRTGTINEKEFDPETMEKL